MRDLTMRDRANYQSPRKKIGEPIARHGRISYRFLRARWLAMLLLPLAIAGPAARGATIYVTTTQERVVGGPGCSLQEAIFAANLQTNLAIEDILPDGSDVFARTNCVPGTGNDTIVLPTGGVFYLSAPIVDPHSPLGPAATPMVFSHITIEGNGSVLQWVGTGPARAFSVAGASVNLRGGGTVSGTGDLTIRNLEIRNFAVKGGYGGDGGGGGMGAGGPSTRSSAR
jgi:hypothetical protein